MSARFLLAAALALLPVPALAKAPAPIGLQDSFRLGSGPGILCSAQSSGSDPALKDVFDRAYAIVCRDAAIPVGRLYAIRLRGGDPAARLAAIRSASAECGQVARTDVEGLGPVEVASCTLRRGNVAYRAYLLRKGNSFYAAEGLAGYDSALRLGLRTIVADAPVPGEIAIATTEVGDAAAFARIQAGNLDPAAARAEAYRRNNSGNYAEASEFFTTLIAADPASGGRAEALVNQAVQRSNLGHFAEASALFAEAGQDAAADPVVARMLRNYRAIHFINQRQPGAALAELDRPLPPGASFPKLEGRDPVIDARTAARLNSESAVARQLAGAGSGLLPEERAEILDGQALHLRGTVLRLQGRDEPAEAALAAASARLAVVRNGRVTSTLWMRAQILGERAAIAEARGDRGGAERLHQASIAMLESGHPGSAALLSAQARLATHYARTGRTGPARNLFRLIVEANSSSGTSSQTLRRTLAPYFAMLAAEGESPDAVADMFKASQILMRPGVAQTQAVMARELSGGSDEASRLFRQSVNLTRDIERARVEISRLAASPVPTNDQAQLLLAMRAQLASWEQDQVATQAKLAEFPRYRVLSGGTMGLDELQHLLAPGEAYYKLTVVGDDLYAIFATARAARAFRIDSGAADLERQVDSLRATIALVEKKQLLTYPFDVELAHQMYRQLFGPVDSELAPVSHLIFEPDGAMLRLPPNLLIAERSGVDAYLARARRSGDDGFDFTDIQWLGRQREVSTAVSASSFRDVRRVPPSRAPNSYIGFGQNEPPAGTVLTRSISRGLFGDGTTCAWSAMEWAKPISAAELYTARRSVEQSGEDGGQIVTGEAFTDNAIKARKDLGQYRVLHFATHGLVSAPRPECPARPALMTSFGSGESDGLLTFSEIFGLRIDADLVILSACDTAGKASLAATREAGITSGGDFALDGLVRAFVGAGGRSVIASHWPVPDDYDATNRLISGMFAAAHGTSIAGALRLAEVALMDNVLTSHPYYWAGFAIIGDGAAILSRP